MWGKINLFCPICGVAFRYNANKFTTETYHHKSFGILDSKLCFDVAQNKYAKMILGKDDDHENPQRTNT